MTESVVRGSVARANCERYRVRIPCDMMECHGLNVGTGVISEQLGYFCFTILETKSDGLKKGNTTCVHLSFFSGGQVCVSGPSNEEASAGCVAQGNHHSLS